MADISHGLMIKYGLSRSPSQGLVDQWLALTIRLINQGHPSEEAGRAAAKVIFPDFDSHFYASEADTIGHLLGRAREK